MDPGPAGPELAEKYGVPLYPSLAELFSKDKPDGIILATPNQMHVPTMRVKIFEGKRSWWEPFATSTESVDRTDPLTNPVKHFDDFIRGAAEPICSGRNGLKTLQVVDAVVESARTGRPVTN